MKFRFIFILGSLLITSAVNSQNFAPDRQGYISAPAFRKLIQQKGYQLVTTFDTVQRNPVLVAATVIKDGQRRKIDMKGELLPLAKEWSPAITGQKGYVNDEIRIEEPAESRNKKPDPFTQLYVNGKFGTEDKLLKKTGLPAIYDGLEWWGNGVLQVKLSGKVGIALSNGNVLLPPKYDQIQEIRSLKKVSKVYVVVQDRKMGLLDDKFKETCSVMYDYISDCSNCDLSDRLLTTTINGKDGLITRSGKEVLPPTYDRIRGLLNKAPLLVSINKKYGLIDSLGKVVLDPIYDKVEYSFYDKLINITMGYPQSKHGLADLTGKIILQPIYDYIQAFEKDSAIVNLKDKKGMIARSGKLLFDPIYETIRPYYTNNIVLLKKEGKVGAADFKGKLLLPFEYDDLAYGNKSYYFKKAGISGIMNPLGKKIISLNYDDVTYANNYLIVKSKGKYGVINMAGEEIIAVKFDRFVNTMGFLKDGTAEITLDGKRGIIDRYGNEFYFK